MVHITFPLPFQRSSNSNSLDYLSLDDLYQSLDLGEPRPLGSLCCDDTQILSTSQHTQQLLPISKLIYVYCIHAVNKLCNGVSNWEKTDQASGKQNQQVGFVFPCSKVELLGWS